MTKHELLPPVNPNYAATIIRVRSTIALENCDNLVGVAALGYQALTTRDVALGELYVLFTAETQLSGAFAAYNDLFRHSHLNRHVDQVGYLEDNRRVKAIRLRGHRSSALILPLASLAYTEYDLSLLKEGDTFDQLNGHEICRKFVLRTKGQSSVAGVSVRFSRVDESHFPRHFDTENYFRNSLRIPPLRSAAITQKLHGTSLRVAHTIVQRKFSKLELGIQWLARKLRLPVQLQETEYAYVYGSRNVVKDPDNPFEDPGYHGTDIWTTVGQRLKGRLPKNYVVYGEIVGWASEDKPIQPGYTYGIPRGEAEFYVYRVAFVNESGLATDLSWQQVKEFCDLIGVPHVPELYYGRQVTEAFVDAFLDRRFADVDNGLHFALPVDEGKVDEGVCIRSDGLIPVILKAKSPKFLEHESKQYDKGEVDIEAIEEVAA